MILLPDNQGLDQTARPRCLIKAMAVCTFSEVMFSLERPYNPISYRMCEYYKNTGTLSLPYTIYVQAGLGQSIRQNQMY